jgi:hypothetical protein
MIYPCYPMPPMCLLVSQRCWDGSERRFAWDEDEDEDEDEVEDGDDEEEDGGNDDDMANCNDEM